MASSICVLMLKSKQDSMEVLLNMLASYVCHDSCLFYFGTINRQLWFFPIKPVSIHKNRTSIDISSLAKSNNSIALIITKYPIFMLSLALPTSELKDLNCTSFSLCFFFKKTPY